MISESNSRCSLFFNVFNKFVFCENIKLIKPQLFSGDATFNLHSIEN